MGRRAGVLVFLPQTNNTRAALGTIAFPRLRPSPLHGAAVAMAAAGRAASHTTELQATQPGGKSHNRAEGATPEAQERCK